MYSKLVFNSNETHYNFQRIRDFHHRYQFSRFLVILNLESELINIFMKVARMNRM